MSPAIELSDAIIYLQPKLQCDVQIDALHSLHIVTVVLNANVVLLTIAAMHTHTHCTQQVAREDRARESNPNACLLCLHESLLFEPMVYYCNGEGCSGQRIRRNNYFYVGGNNQYHRCMPVRYYAKATVIDTRISVLLV
jgi:hypothetical protein